MNFANQVKNTLLQDIANMANVSWFFSKHPETDFTRNPQDPETYFPPDGKTTNGYNQVHLVALFDLLSGRFTDCTVQPIRKKNEFLALTQMIDRCDLPDAVPIFIADRGFHSFNVFAHAIEHNAYFLIRAKDVNMRRLLGQDIPDASFSTAEIKSLYGLGIYFRPQRRLSTSSSLAYLKATSSLNTELPLSLSLCNASRFISSVTFASYISQI